MWTSNSCSWRLNRLRAFCQVIGSLQSVQDALFHITSRLRETIFPMKPPPPNFSAPPYLSPFPEIPSFFRPRHNPASPGNYPSPVGHPHGHDRSAIASQPLDHHPTFSHSMDRSVPSNMDRVPYPYGSERPGHVFDLPSSSPRSWTPQVGCLTDHLFSKVWCFNFIGQSWGKLTYFHMFFRLIFSLSLSGS